MSPRSRAAAVVALAERASRRLRLTVLHELEREHRAEPADLADGVDASRNRLEARPDPLADLVGAPAEVLARDLVQNGQRRRAGERVPAEGAAEAAGRDGVDDLRRSGDAGERKPAAERLAGDEEIGLDAVVLDRPDRPGPSDSGLHLVVHVEDPVALAELLQPRGKVERHVHEAALALHRLEHDAGDRLRVDIGLEERLELVDRVLGRHASVRIRGGRAVDLGREGPEARACRGRPCSSSSWSGACGRGRRGRRRRPPGRPVAARAILTAFSTASAPEFRRRLFCCSPRHGESSARRRQTSTYGSYIPTMKHWWR